jgi:hypothetical protein
MPLPTLRRLESRVSWSYACRRLVQDDEHSPTTHGAVCTYTRDNPPRDLLPATIAPEPCGIPAILFARFWRLLIKLRHLARKEFALAWA